METTNTMSGSISTPHSTKSKINFKKITKILLTGMISIFLIYSVANYFWKMSGSSQWEFEGEKLGVKVYSLKTPGYTVKKFKAVTEVHSTMGGLVEMFYNADICADWLLACVSAKVIERTDIPHVKSPRLLYVQAILKPAIPFAEAREFVVKTQYITNKKTKEIFYEVSSVPDILPFDPCCIRVRLINNSWRFTPLETGKVRVEHILDMDLGGFIPDFLYNFGEPQDLYKLLGTFIPDVLKRERLQNANYDYMYDLEGDI